MPPVTSSAINKSKTVAPKAIARRRPAAAAQKAKPSPAPAPASTPQSQPEQDASEGASQTDAAPQTNAAPIVQPAVTQSSTIHEQHTAPLVTPQVQPQSQVQPEPQTQPQSQVQPTPAVDTRAPLPTPPATQQPATVQPTPPPTLPEPSSTVNVPASPQPVASVSPLPESLDETQAQTSQETAGQPSSVSAPDHGQLDQSASTVPDIVASGGAEAGQEITSSESSTRIPSPPPVAGAKRKRNAPHVEQQPAVREEHSPPTHDVVMQGSGPENEPAQEAEDTINAGAAPMAQMISPERVRTRGTQAAARTTTSVPKPTKPARAPRAKRQKKATAPEVAQSETEDVPAQPTVEAVTAEEQQGEDAPPAAAPAKKKAKTKRQPKSAARVVEDEDGNVIDDPEPAQEETDQPARKQRKSRQPRKSTEPKEPKEPKEKKERKKKRDPREIAAEDEDIEDPEHYEIDPNNVKMSDLTRDRGVGRQSQRETKMAGIDWEEVARKRLEAAEAIRAGTATGLDGAPSQDQASSTSVGEAAVQPARTGGPRMVLDNDGNLVVDQESLQIDRQAQAAADAANMVVTEEDDLTKRVNQMSWISARKRDPTERLPFFKMKSDPWSEEETDRFYEALKMFGTDFFIISKMFPPKTRRQIKLKFIREERLDADRINRALSGESTVPMSLDHFAEATGQELENFKDPRLLEEELRVEGEEQREEIARKKKEMDEAKQQRDVQMAARERENAERSRLRKNKAAARRGGRGPIGTGTF